ncbi:MAG: dephospho-CoA kinase [Gemmataceae bacterium]
MSSRIHPPVIGLVGAIGAGKSTVANDLVRRGGVLIPGDELGHEVLREPEIQRQLLARWGERVRAQGGQLDRRAIAKIVFVDAAEKAFLESLLFPRIRARAEELILAARANPQVTCIVLDAALLLEAGWESVCNYILGVDAPRALREARVLARSGWTPAELAAREASQWPLERKWAACDVVIVNDSTVTALQQNLDPIIGPWILPPRPARTADAG